MRRTSMNGTEFFFGESTRRLRPESIDTHELVWERYTNDWLRTSLSAYWYQADGLITPTPDRRRSWERRTSMEGMSGPTASRSNPDATRCRASGSDELCVAARRGHSNRAVLVNSPGQMAKFRLSVPGPSTLSVVSVEVLSMSSRRTLAGDTLEPAATANVTMIAPVGTRFELVGGVMNLFDVQYADPVSDQHQQIPLDATAWRFESACVGKSGRSNRVTRMSVVGFSRRDRVMRVPPGPRELLGPLPTDSHRFGEEAGQEKDGGVQDRHHAKAWVACPTRSRGSPCEPGSAPDAHPRCASSGRRRVGLPVPGFIGADCTSVENA